MRLPFRYSCGIVATLILARVETEIGIGDHEHKHLRDTQVSMIVAGWQNIFVLNLLERQAILNSIHVLDKKRSKLTLLFRQFERLIESPSLGKGIIQQSSDLQRGELKSENL